MRLKQVIPQPKDIVVAVLYALAEMRYGREARKFGLEFGPRGFVFIPR